MACPNEMNKEKKEQKKIRKYQQLCYEIGERREGHTVNIIPSVIGCLRGGIKKLEAILKNCSIMKRSSIRLYMRYKRLFFGKAYRLCGKYRQDYCRHEVLYSYIS